ncbi:cation efflux protein [Chytridium lagenaria]|nr:cation efflux protein [Chytridium lagenaria]
MKLAKQGQMTSTFTYGFKRAEVLGICEWVLLMSLCFSIVVEALGRLIEPVEIDNPEYVLVVGVCGLTMNIVGMLLLKSATLSSPLSLPSKSSDPNPFTDPKPYDYIETLSDTLSDTPHLITIPTPAPTPRPPRNANMRALFLHALGDAAGNVAVIASILSDPVLSLVITVIIGGTALELVKSTGRVLVEGVPEGVDVEVVRREVEGVEGVSFLYFIFLLSPLILSHLKLFVYFRKAFFFPVMK